MITLTKQEKRRIVKLKVTPGGTPYVDRATVLMSPQEFVQLIQERIDRKRQGELG